MGNFFVDVLSVNPYFTTTDPVGDLSLLEPETRRRVEALIADAASEGVALMAFETFRSKERQQLLFEQKVTKLQTVGVHHYGLACDIVRNVGGHPSWKGDFAILGRLARKHGLVWGGDWGRPDVTPSFVDPVHVQRCPVSRQKALFAGSWYPDDAYDPWSELPPVARSMHRSRRRRARTRSRTPRGKSPRSAKPAKAPTKRRGKRA